MKKRFDVMSDGSLCDVTTSNVRVVRQMYKGAFDLKKDRSLAVRALIRNGRYTDYGGYEIAVITADGGMLCVGCVKENWPEIARAIRSEHKIGGWYPEQTSIYQENETCDHCYHEFGEPL